MWSYANLQSVLIFFTIITAYCIRPPDAKIFAFKPKGIYLTFPYYKVIQNITFYGKLNSTLDDLENADFVLNDFIKFGDEFVALDQNIELTNGTLFFHIHIKGSGVSDFIVKDSEKIVLQPSPVSVTAYEPRGIRISLPYNEDVEGFAFWANINSPLLNPKKALIRLSAIEQINGSWMAEDNDVMLFVNDILNYTLQIRRQGKVETYANFPVLRIQEKTSTTFLPTATTSTEEPEITPALTAAATTTIHTTASPPTTDTTANTKTSITSARKTTSRDFNHTPVYCSWPFSQCTSKAYNNYVDSTTKSSLYFSPTAATTTTTTTTKETDTTPATTTAATTTRHTTVLFPTTDTTAITKTSTASARTTTSEDNNHVDSTTKSSLYFNTRTSLPTINTNFGRDNYFTPKTTLLSSTEATAIFSTSMMHPDSGKAYSQVESMSTPAKTYTGTYTSSTATPNRRSTDKYPYLFLKYGTTTKRSFGRYPSVNYARYHTPFYRTVSSVNHAYDTSTTLSPDSVSTNRQFTTTELPFIISCVPYYNSNLKIISYYPRGMRVILPSDNKIEFFYFWAIINGNINKDSIVTLTGFKASSGIWSAMDDYISLLKGDVVNYTFIIKRGEKLYSQPFKQFVIKEMTTLKYFGDLSTISERSQNSTVSEENAD